MAAEKTVKVKFEGSSKGLSAAAKVAARIVRAWGKQVDKVKKKTDAWANSDNSAKKWAGKTLQAIGTVLSVASKVGKGIMSTIGGAMEAAGPLVKAALVAALVAAAVAAGPAIAAAISTGVILGVGGGVIAAGIALAAKSPKVKTAATNLKNRFLDIDTADLEEDYKAAQERMTTATGKEAKKRAAAELKEAKKALDEANAYNKKNFSLRDAAKPFIEPLERALKRFEGAADKLIPKFAGLSKILAPVIDKLAPALVSMAERAMPGIEAAAKASLPFFDTLARHAPKLGDAIARFFGHIAEGGPEANRFFGDMLTVLEYTISHLGALIRALAEMYDVTVRVTKFFAEAFKLAVRVALDAIGTLVSGAAKAFGWIPGLGPKLKTAAQEFEQFKNKVNRALNGIKDKVVGVDVAVRVTGNKNSSAVASALRKQNIPGFATGGWARGLYMAGENGPELIRSGGGADRVYSNRETQSLFQPEVRVYIGDQELRGMVRVEMQQRDRGLKRRVAAGAGASR